MKESEDNSEKIPELFLKNKKNIETPKSTRKIKASDRKVAKKEELKVVEKKEEPKVEETKVVGKNNYNLVLQILTCLYE